MTKRCPKCGEIKGAEGFNKSVRRADGLASWCKSCMAEYQRAYTQRPEVRAKNAERALARYHALPADEKRRIQKRSYGQARYLMQKYHLTVEQYDAILRAQGGVCAICDEPPAVGRRLAVDHDHACCPSEETCGRCIRGLLCTTCNVWLGFYENPLWVARAVDYLDREIANRERDTP